MDHISSNTTRWLGIEKFAQPALGFEERGEGGEMGGGDGSNYDLGLVRELWNAIYLSSKKLPHPNLRPLEGKVVRRVLSATSPIKMIIRANTLKNKNVGGRIS